MISAHRFAPALAVLGMAFLSAPFWCGPHAVSAAEIPEQISLVANDTIRVIEHQELKNWFEVGQTTVFDEQRTSEGEVPKTLCQDFKFFCEAWVPRQLLTHIVTSKTFALRENVAREALLAMIDELERDPINAKLALDNTGGLSVTAEAVPGLRIDREASLREALDILGRNGIHSTLRIPLVAEATPAKVSRDSISQLGLHAKISEGKTNFRGSPKNRIFNIYRAIEQFDGIVIAPGEEFSFVKYLGDVDGEHGYLPELVIKNNRTEPEFGGGICQVSTTVFRAALFAGLEITERKNHAYPVQYYRPYGMDATIYIPRPDLKFKNNTPGSILMLPKIVGTELSFTFYGTNDDRVTTIDGPHILESNPDGSMRTIFTQTVKDASGTTVVNATFPSNYKSPSLFPHPGEEIITEKPKGWSSRQWKEYKAIHP